MSLICTGGAAARAYKAGAKYANGESLSEGGQRGSGRRDFGGKRRTGKNRPVSWVGIGERPHNRYRCFVFLAHLEI